MEKDLHIKCIQKNGDAFFLNLHVPVQLWVSSRRICILRLLISLTSHFSHFFLFLATFCQRLLNYNPNGKQQIKQIDTQLTGLLVQVVGNASSANLLIKTINCS